MTSKRFAGLGATLALVGSVLCWGAVPVLLRDLRHSIDAWTANGFRYTFSAVLYWPVLILAVRSGHLNRRVVVRCIIPAMLALGGQILWGLAPYYLEASAIGFFVRLSLVWSLVGAMTLFADERRLLRLPRFYLGLLTSVGGFVALSISKSSHGALLSVTGVAIILVCSVFFGGYAVSVRQFMRDIHPIHSFGVVSQFVSMGTLVAMFCFGEPVRLGDIDARAWIELIVSSVLGIALGHILLYTAIHRTGAAIASGVHSVTPFITAALALAFLDESMSGIEWSGGIAMVLGAVTLLSAQSAVRPS
jgi:drug/metabolite transporter (DMT)-like permease